MIESVFIDSEEDLDMPTDVQTLERLNLEIGARETSGDVEFFRTLLAPSFAMRRANGDVLDRMAFLDAIGEGAERPTAVQGVTLLGETRALVISVVGMRGKEYHNVRLFVRSSPADAWKLLAWANEPV